MQRPGESRRRKKIKRGLVGRDSQCSGCSWRPLKPSAVSTRLRKYLVNTGQVPELEALPTAGKCQHGTDETA